MCTVLSIDDVGVLRDNAFRRYDRAMVLKPAISLKKRRGGLPQNDSNVIFDLK